MMFPHGSESFTFASLFGLGLPGMLVCERLWLDLRETWVMIGYEHGLRWAGLRLDPNGEVLCEFCALPSEKIVKW